MTTVAAPLSAPTVRARQLAGTGPLLRLALRRDRVLIPAWVLGLGLVVAGTGSSFEALYDTAARRAALAASMNGNGSMRALYGPVFGDSVGGLIAWRMAGFGAVLAAVMSLLIVVRHTREEEETGRQELLCAAMVGRRAPLTAALLTALTANAALAAVIAGGLAGAGRPAAGSLALGLAIGGTGMLFAALAAIAAQLTESARLAKGLTGAALGLAFALRAAGDTATTDGTSPLTWISPIGWSQNLRAYAGERWWLALLFLAATALAGSVAYALTARRDLGMSFLPARPGPAVAPRSLSGPFGLAWRLQRTTLGGWTLGFVCAGGLFGGIAKGAADLVGGNERTREIFARMGGQQSLTDAFLATMAGMLGMVAALYAVGAVLRLHGEETGGRAEPVLAGAVSRLRWTAGHLALAYGGSAVILAFGGLALGVSYDLSAGDPGGRTGPVLAAALAQVPAVWTLTGLAVLVFGLLPRATTAAWALVGGCLALGWAGPSLDFPRWAMDLSPYGHLPKLPGADATAAPFLWLLALSALFTAAGLVGVRRRDLG
ncbi:ABC-2 type transport system permease protein [Streptomyces sp. 2333.5]|uniref:ABC transporter permease n=1 Tax=unclassified Streptomyces TaxID=2593676 RepID=UPI0008980705|nr:MULTISPECIES: ABC transporter permease [unclassified Streptomyces]PJJ02916.1 ABC-2 type transport system permease protein [Streptomyces sp. 2333.5]SED67947.1 ABC-2 type transport system permease protein [Streptomyces sp. 2314.4]SEE21198.1 ABC-2 type transport system permease protein [Streptomyces sp. 2112.2]